MGRMLMIFSVCLCLPLTTARAQERGDGHRGDEEAVMKEILRLEEVGRQKALKGDGRWDDLVAEGAYLIQWDGTVLVYRRGENLAPAPLKSVAFSDMIVRVYGPSAVVTGLSEFEGETAEKKPFTLRMRFLNVWKKFDGGWKIVVSERTGVRGSFR